MKRWSPTILAVGGGVSCMQREALLGALSRARRSGWTAVSEEVIPVDMVGAKQRGKAWDAGARDIRQSVRRLERWIHDWQPKAVLMMFALPEMVSRAASLAPTVAAMAYTGKAQMPSIDVDQRAVTQVAAKHLLSLGLRHFAVAGTWALPWAVERAKFFAEQIRAAGFECRISPRRPTPSDELPLWNVSRAKMEQWLQSLPKPVGILACSDRSGMHLMHHCRAANIRVPEDAAILCIDNDDVFCTMSHSPLSSVAINWRQIGYEAAELAGRLADGQAVRPTRKLFGPAGVVVRQSTDLQAVDDPEVASALRIIRAHADQPLSVSQLLRRIPVHRNRLERRFLQVVGRRILQEIRRVHVEHAKRLLASTDLAIASVAGRSGFASPSKFSVAFARETGLTPSAYRRKFRLHP